MDGPFPELDSDFLPDSNKQGEEEEETEEEAHVEFHPRIRATDDNTKGWHDVEEAPPRKPSSPILREPKLSDHEQQAVVNLDSDDDSDDSSLSHIRRDVRELQQELGMEPQEPLLSDDESEDEYIYGAPQQCPTVRFEDSADPSPTQDPPTQDTSPSHTRRGTQCGRRVNPMFRSINSR